MAGLAGDHDAGPAGRDDLAELLQYQGHADEVDSDDRLRRGLRRGQPGGVHHISHGAKVAGSGGEVVDGFVGGDVDRRRARGEPGSPQRIRGCRRCFLVEVRQQDRLADPNAAGDRLTHGPGTDNDNQLGCCGHDHCGPSERSRPD